MTNTSAAVVLTVLSVALLHTVSLRRVSEDEQRLTEDKNETIDTPREVRAKIQLPDVFERLRNNNSNETFEEDEKSYSEDKNETIQTPREVRAKIYFTDELYQDALVRLRRQNGSKTFEEDEESYSEDKNETIQTP